MKNKVSKIINVSAIALFMSMMSIGSFCSAASPRTKLEATGKAIGLEGNFSTLTGTIIMGILGAVAIIFLILVVYAGLLWLLAQGETTKIKKAKDLLIWSTAGVVIMFLSYGITYFFFFSVLFNKVGR
ncbi:MAG: hypothetical protein WCV92_00750 [Candidatus Buchananbacteria bacterium]